MHFAKHLRLLSCFVAVLLVEFCETCRMPRLSTFQLQCVQREERLQGGQGGKGGGAKDFWVTAALRASGMIKR